MIISASRRTDIPARYSDWFFRRLREGYVCVPNPMNIHSVSRVPLSPDVVDGIVFWTKNPAPMLSRLDELKDYAYYFQFTVTPYGRDMEPNIPCKNDVIIPAFRALAKKLGPERVIWRYDPIIITDKYSVGYHLKYFGELALRLSGYTRMCVISFVDMYRSTGANTKGMGLHPLDRAGMLELGGRLAELGAKYGLTLAACGEKTDLEPVGILKSRCIDAGLLQKILGCRLKAEKDRNQRPECGCAASIDIGMYDTCPNGCRYCYANRSGKALERNIRLHDPASPVLTGRIGPEDTVKERRAVSCRDWQTNLFQQ